MAVVVLPILFSLQILVCEDSNLHWYSCGGILYPKRNLWHRYINDKYSSENIKPRLVRCGSSTNIDHCSGPLMDFSLQPGKIDCRDDLQLFNTTGILQEKKIMV